MLLVKSRIFSDNIKYTKHRETNLYLNNAYMCWLDKSFASKLKLFSIILFEFRYIFFIISEFFIKSPRDLKSDPPPRDHDFGRDLSLRTTVRQNSYSYAYTRASACVYCYTDNLTPDLRNTAHGCSGHGPAAAWLWSSRPGNVISVLQNIYSVWRRSTLSILIATLVYAANNVSVCYELLC
jgi:hypothetical protein